MTTAFWLGTGVGLLIGVIITDIAWRWLYTGMREFYETMLYRDPGKK
jgi:hypothetical protein